MADQYRLAVLDRHHRLGNIFRPGNAADALDQVFLPVLGVVTRRRVAVGTLDGLDRLVDGQAIGCQPFRLQRHLELLQIAADGQHLGDTRHRQQAFAQHIVGGVLQRHRPASADFCGVVPGQGDEHDFAHDRRRRGHHRRLDARG